MKHLANNWDRIRRNIDDACRRTGRKDRPRVIVASKYMSVDEIRQLYKLGLREFAENQIQSAQEKIASLSDLDISWHFIGHLQSNKINKFLSLPFVLLHSVDRIELIDKLVLRAKRLSKVVNCLIEVNLSGEETKYGLRSEEEVAQVVSKIKSLPNLNCVGIMTMAPYTNDEKVIREVFRRARCLRDRFNLKELSMGMSNDYIVAVEEGATLLRIGSAFLMG